tara:strand:+ start:659 stop:868 length:210 start_codon:yes stop_codon:yes gene_type:complete
MNFMLLLVFVWMFFDFIGSAEVFKNELRFLKRLSYFNLIKAYGKPQSIVGSYGKYCFGYRVTILLSFSF